MRYLNLLISTFPSTYGFKYYPCVWNGRRWTVLSRFRVGKFGGLWESGDEFSGSIKCGEVLEWLRKDLPLRNDCAVWNQLLTYIKYYKHQYIAYCIK